MNATVFSFFGIADPVLAPIDGILGFLPAWMALCLWGVVAGLASMMLYKRFSAQQELATIVEETKELRDQMNATDSSDPAYRQLLGRQMKLGGKRLWKSLAPALLSSLPVIFLAVFLDGRYGLSEPEAGKPVAILAEQPELIRVQGGQQLSAGWLVNWPGPGEVLSIMDEAGSTLLEIGNDTRPGLAAAPGVMRFLFGAPAGALPADAKVDSLMIETTPRDIAFVNQVFPFQWTIPFFLALIMASLGLKFALRIK